jgi:hypothetical protein
MLIVLSVHCLIGGGQTPILAAGFKTISEQFDVSISKMSYTTGVYMLFLGLGSVIAAPTALLYGKRPGPNPPKSPPSPHPPQLEPF